MRINTRKHSVESSNLAAVGYSRKHGVLDVTFKSSGDTYRYFNVPRKIYDRLMRATSKGIFYNTYIRGNKDYMSLLNWIRRSQILHHYSNQPIPICIRNYRYLVINGQTGWQ